MQWAPTSGVLVLGSGKGGVGTSTVSALLALVAAQEGRQVLLVDADHFGDEEEGQGNRNGLYEIAFPLLGDGVDRGRRDLSKRAFELLDHSLARCRGRCTRQG